ncbi:hypothetical protein EDC19_1236 [Natranaerovirga hydrolytica]|uniref:Nitrogen regulatory protein P-II family n=1 Tax=Natranaerovirga hydrolytica TaxID=680378 RepID=A0A4R1MZM7_9FIRM|nr:hypothetical protein [Natranaerovirga hydrolytica]TCK98797.1 hypothetical protein EDC19_1236 [Natranaerovirga hydrolytica]
MKLLIAIINNPEKVVDILDEFYKVEINGATVMDSTGMAHIMANYVPFFSRFAEVGDEPTANKSIFVVIHSEDQLLKAIQSIEKIIGDLNEPDTGVVMTVPIDFQKGLFKKEGNEFRL